MSFEDMSLGELAKLAERTREAKRELDRQSKDKGKEFEAMQAVLTQKLDEIGVDKISVDGISLSIAEQDMPQAADWEALSEYLLSTGYLHLLQRRISATAYRELLASGESVPGIDVWTKRSVNMRVS